jgi:hypothetical protein
MGDLLDMYNIGIVSSETVEVRIQERTGRMGKKRKKGIYPIKNNNLGQG